MWSWDLLYDHDTNLCAFRRVWNCSHLLQVWLLPWPRCWKTLLLFKTGNIRAICEAHNKQCEQPSTKWASSQCIRETGFPQWTNVELRAGQRKSRHHSYVTEGVKIVLNSTNRGAWTLTLHHLSFPLQASFLLTHNLYWLPVSPVLRAWFCLPFTFHREKLDVNVLEVSGAAYSDSSVTETPAHTHHTHTPSCKNWRCSLML